jgi:IS30 family transposase
LFKVKLGGSFSPEGAAEGSRERGTRDNTNGLLRQYLPKGTGLSELTDWQLSSYTLELNQRPRKCLNYRTAAEVFHERHVALTM